MRLTRSTTTKTGCDEHSHDSRYCETLSSAVAVLAVISPYRVPRPHCEDTFLEATVAKPACLATNQAAGHVGSGKRRQAGAKPAIWISP